jgi:hypothetical protein
MPYPKIKEIMLVKGLQWQSRCHFSIYIVCHIQAKDASRRIDVSKIDIVKSKTTW